MRILLLVGSYDPEICGVGDYTRVLAQNLERAGHELIIVTLCESCQPGVVENGRVSVVRLDQSKWRLGVLPELISVIKRFQPDVVNIQYESNSFDRSLLPNVIPIIRFLFKKPIVTTVHELWGPEVGGRLAIYLMLRLSDYVIVNDKTIFERIITNIPSIKPRSVLSFSGTTIPLNTNDELTAYLQRVTLGFYSDKLIISYFGFINPSKGLETLFRALSQLNKDYKLLIISNYDSRDRYHRSLKQLGKDLAIDDKIFWMHNPSETEVSAYLQASNLCILPFNDGVSLRRTSFLAALAHGLPLITTKASATPASLRDGENVLLTEPGNADQLLGAIKKFDNSKKLRQKLYQGSKELFQRYSWEILTKQIEGIYRKVL